MSNTNWTLELALPVIRRIEDIASQTGFHTALTGSVLFRGESNEDLDIILYPRKTERRKDVVALVDNLRTQGFHNWELRDHLYLWCWEFWHYAAQF